MSLLSERAITCMLRRAQQMPSCPITARDRQPIPLGARGSYTLRVESRHLANTFKDSILPPVFSTPYLILIMENAALNAVKAYLEAGESAVGTRVDVRHLTATGRPRIR